MLAFSILRMVIVRIPEDHGWVPAYPTSGTAIEFQFLSLFVIVSFLKVHARARARKAVSVRSGESRFISAVGRSDGDLYYLRWTWREVNRSFVADVCPSSGVALSRSRAQERSAPVASYLGLLPNHCAIEVRTITRDDLKQLHD